jgi:hypothetical protein
VRPLLWFVGGLTFFTIVVCVAMLLMFMYFQSREESQELKASPLARQGAERLPPEPRLQLAPGWQVQTDGGERHELSYGVKTDHVPQPWSEYTIVGDEWRRELEDYGWADEKAGTVRVPIEQAMRVYLQRRQAGQPPQGARPAAPNAQAGAAQQAPRETTPADSSSGQQPEQKHQ